MPRRQGHLGRGPTHPKGGKRMPSPRSPTAPTGPVDPGASGGTERQARRARATGPRRAPGGSSDEQ
eukprot:2237346-Alexandrium_andersonii.AAC.1